MAKKEKKKENKNDSVMPIIVSMASRSSFISTRFQCTTRWRFQLRRSSQYTEFPHDGLTGRLGSENGAFSASKGTMQIIWAGQAYCSWLPREWGRHLMSQGDRATMRTTGFFLKCRKSLVVALNNTDLRLLEPLLLWLLLLLLLLLILEMLFILLLLLLPQCPRTTSVGILSLINRVI